jgi:DNA (cytosine-5)-methyltransferase 1
MSIAGARKGLNGSRSGLFYEYVKILRAKKPRYFIWENVKGALNSNQGWDFAEVQSEFSEAGYDFEWKILNAKDFGVPQNRERVFVIGYLREGRSEEILLKEQDNRKDNKKTSSRKNGDDEDVKIKRELSFYGGVGSKWNKKSDKNQSRDFKQGNRVYIEDGISPQLNANTGNSAQGSVLVAYSKSTRKDHMDHRARINDNANTLNTGDGCVSQSSANYISEKEKIRRLTPTECEALMSWPKNHTKWGINKDGVKFELSDSKRYKQCGNGVVSNVVSAISEVIWEDFTQMHSNALALKGGVNAGQHTVYDSHN